MVLVWGRAVGRGNLNNEAAAGRKICRREVALNRRLTVALSRESIVSQMGELMFGEESLESESSLARRERISSRSRDPQWKKPPRRIESSECIACNSCVRSCPPEFGAIFNHGMDVVIIPELCSGCPKCVMACPVDCIYVDEDWAPVSEELWIYPSRGEDSHG